MTRYIASGPFGLLTNRLQYHCQRGEEKEEEVDPLEVFFYHIHEFLFPVKSPPTVVSSPVLSSPVVVSSPVNIFAG